MNQNNFCLDAEFLKSMQKMLGDDFEKYQKAMQEPAVRGLRVNTKKVAVEKFLSIFDLPLSKTGFSNEGFVLESDEKVGNRPEHLAGLFYLQEPSSMIVVEASDIEKENRPLRVLDLCASPGGKTGQIACKLGEDSLIFSNEISRQRAEVLYSNIERQGFKNVIVLNEEPQNLLQFQGFFDYVFVDAPCSGEGMFRKNPETISEWSEGIVQKCVQRQKEILSIAKNLTSAGGKLIYSTCTFNECEDEQIAEFLQSSSSLKIVSPSERIKSVTLAGKGSKDVENCRKFYPFCSRGEGQFVAVFKDFGEEKISKLFTKKHYSKINQIGARDYAIFCEFMRANFKDVYSKNMLLKIGKNIFLKPTAFDEKIQTALDELKIISIGVKLGSIEKDRFEPDHCAFMSVCENFKFKFELNDKQIKKYLHGEQLALSEIFDADGEVLSGAIKGYGVATFKGYALGGVKIVGGALKNLLPKGLRL